MKQSDYTTEYCPYCDQKVSIPHTTGITACPNCGNPLLPCNACMDDYGCCVEPCHYDCDSSE